MARAIAQETQQLETELNDERSRYQNLLTEHLRLEEKYEDLKEDMASSVSDTQAGSAYDQIHKCDHTVIYCCQSFMDTFRQYSYFI